MKKLVRFDWAIKRLLRNKANYAILEGLLSVLLKEDIKIDQILESESNQQTGDNKSNRVDMLVINSKGEYIIIEVQINRKQDYLMRMLFGTSKLIVDNLQKGMGYNEIKKVISVNIVYFDLGQGSDYVYHGTTSFVGIHNADTLGLSKDQERLYHTSVIANLYPEYYLLKIDNFDTVAENDLDQWIYFLKNDEIKDSFNAKGLREAKSELDVLKLSEKDRIGYEQYIDDWRDMNSLTVTNYDAGYEKGKWEKEQYAKEREKLKQLEMATKCKKKGMPVSEIADLTGLTEEEINIL